jgi:hypothetical protein
MLIAVAVVLILIAIVAGIVALVGRRHLAQMSGATLNVSDARAAAGQGKVEFAGAAAAGPGGLLKAPYSGAECVWYSSRTIARYEVRQSYRDANGNENWRTEQRNEVVSSDVSPQAFTITDSSGSILCDPRDADVDAPVYFSDFQQPAGGINIGPLHLNIGNGNLLGFDREESVIAAGQELFLIGAVRAGADGNATLSKGKGRFLISTRSEEQLTVSASRQARWGSVVAALAGAAGLIVLAASFVVR